MDIETFAGERALVLGGGGSAGNAWLIGVIAGLFDAGKDVTRADLIIGTSAGSTVAAQISSTVQAPELFANILAEVYAPMSADPGRATNRPVLNHMEATSGIINSAKNVADMRRKMGAWALGLDATSPEATQRWRAIVAARLPAQQWPAQQVYITAVDAHTGDPVVFNRHTGVELADAVAASCAAGFAYGIGDRYCIDGGYRTNADNADLAAGYRRVLVLSPFGGRSRTPADWGTHLATQVEALRAKGSSVETIFPDSAALAAFGDNMMDLSRRPLCAQAGYDQGRVLGVGFGGFWG